jgi:hypothetical protein
MATAELIAGVVGFQLQNRACTESASEFTIQ